MCVDVRLILVLVLGRQTVYGQNTVYLCLSKYVVFENTHTHIATAASETEDHFRRRAADRLRAAAARQAARDADRARLL